MLLKKVISGGQTGIDRMGLELAKFFKFETGGTAPKNFRTENGYDVNLRDEFGLTESAFSGYSPRTEKNILDSDGTVILGNTKSAGSKQTESLCVRLRKPCLVNPPTETELISWMVKHNVETLNIAGNRASVLTPGHRSKARNVLKGMLAFWLFAREKQQFTIELDPATLQRTAHC